MIAVADSVKRFDAVVMLTFSNWHTEMRGNRYHYATRLAKLRPVIFVQPDLAECRFEFEPTEITNLSILHVFRSYGLRQSRLLKAALGQRSVTHPLLWIYNHRFLLFMATYRVEQMIYHATEDLFSSVYRLPCFERHVLRTVLRRTDLLIAVSEGVKNSYVEEGKY